MVAGPIEFYLTLAGFMYYFKALSAGVGIYSIDRNPKTGKREIPKELIPVLVLPSGVDIIYYGLSHLWKSEKVKTETIENKLADL